MTHHLLKHLDRMCVAAAIALGTINSVCAMPPFWNEFEAKYVTPNPNQEVVAKFKETRCNVCHVQGEEKTVRNPFGIELSKLLDKEQFKKERLEAEPEKVKAEIVAALEKVTALKSKPDDANSPTFGELIAQGKLPGEVVAAEPPKEAEKPAPEAKPAEAAPIDPAAAQTPAAPTDKVGLIGKLLGELVAEQKAALQAQLKAELKAELKKELKAQLAASLTPQIMAQLRREMRPHTPDAEKGAIVKIEEIGGTVRPIAMNDDSQEVDFHLGGKTLSDDGLAHVKELGKLVHLHLKDTQITDAGLSHISDLTTLTRLHLEMTKVTDEGLRQLQGLGNLEYLNLYGTAVTDAGLSHLAGLDKLRKLYLWQTKVSDEGVKRLTEALPELTVVR